MSEESEELAVIPLDQMAEWVRGYEKATADEKEAKARREEYRKMIAQYFEDHDAEYGTVNGKVRLRWRAVSTSRFNQKKFAQDHPVAYEHYKEESVSNRMELIDDEFKGL
jgi:hypothetical protein